MGNRSRRAKPEPLPPELKKDFERLRRLIRKLEKDGHKVDAINAAIAQLSADVDALVTKGAGAITPTQAASIAQAIMDLDTKIKTALAS